MAGQPLAGATVVAARDGRTYEAVAGEAGEYEIGALPAGDYDVVVHDEDDLAVSAAVRVEGRRQHELVLAPRKSWVTVVVLGKHCSELRRLERGRVRFLCQASPIDRAMREVDQSPRQLKRRR